MNHIEDLLAEICMELDCPPDNEAILMAIARLKRVELALNPFAEIGKRRGWSDMTDDDPHLGDHIIDAPAPDIHPDAAFCLMIGHFRDAAIAAASR